MGGGMRLVWPVAFEILHALEPLILRLTELLLLLLKVMIRAAQECGRTFKLAVEIFPIFPVSDLDMHQQPIGHQVKLVTNPFDEHAVMANPLVHVIEPALNRFKAPIVDIQTLFDRIEAAVMTVQSLFNPIKALINPTELLINPTESLIQILDEFLIHNTSAAM
jgi:hypothetical protein